MAGLYKSKCRATALASCAELRADQCRVRAGSLTLYRKGHRRGVHIAVPP